MDQVPVGQTLVLVGSWTSAREWIEQSGTNPDNVVVTEDPSKLAALDGTGTRLVLLPGWQYVRDFHNVQLEVRLLQRRGATVEWP